MRRAWPSDHRTEQGDDLASLQLIKLHPDPPMNQDCTAEYPIHEVESGGIGARLNPQPLNCWQGRLYLQPCSGRTRFSMTPTPSTSQRTKSPGCRNRCGFMK